MNTSVPVLEFDVAAGHSTDVHAEVSTAGLASVSLLGDIQLVLQVLNPDTGAWENVTSEGSGGVIDIALLGPDDVAEVDIAGLGEGQYRLVVASDALIDLSLLGTVTLSADFTDTGYDTVGSASGDIHDNDALATTAVVSAVSAVETETVPAGGSAEVTGEYGTLVINADGSYVYTVNPDVDIATAQQEVFTLTVSDGVTTDTSTLTFTINPDTTAPPAPGAALEADTGAADDGVTTVGTVLVSGLAAGATWEYTTDGGTTWQAGSGTSFDLAEGTYADGAVQVRQTDGAGNTSEAASLGAVTVDTTAPVAVAASLESDTGTAGDGLTSDGTVLVSGLEAGGSWEYSTDGGTTWQAGTGTSFDLAEGTYADGAVQVRQTDGAGNTGEAASLGPVTVDTTAPTALAASLESDTGTAEDGLTSDGTVLVSGLEAGATWEYSTDGGGTWQAGTGGSFELTEGTYADGAVQVRQTDAAGNTGVAAPLGAVTVDTTAPVAPGAALETDTGASADDEITSDGTVLVSGLEADATWEYSTDGGTTWQAGTGGSFELAEGVYADGAVQVRQTDAAGNTGAAAPLGPITVDSTAPAAPGAALETDTGASAADGITSDGTVLVSGLEAGATWEYTTDGGTTWQAGTGSSFELAEGVYADGVVQVRQTDTAGNIGTTSLGPVTVDATVPVATIDPTAGTLLTGTAGAGDTVEIDVGNDGSVDYTLTADPDGNWSAAVDPALADGTVVNVTATDAAGNESAPVSTTVDASLDDTTPPAAPVILSAADDAPPATDPVSSGGSTNDSTPVLAGTAEANSTVVVFQDGVQVGTVTADEFGDWSFAPATLLDGTYSFTAVAIDAANNTSDSSSAFTLTVDTVAPAAPGAVLEADTGTDGDGITSDGTVLVSGLETGATWEYSTDGGATWQTGSGESFDLAEGTYADGAVQVRQIDAAGNPGAAAPLGPITVDPTAPVAPGAALEADTGASAADGLTSDGTVLVSGLETGTTWEYTTDGGTTWQEGTGGSFELAAGTYADGTVLVRQTDTAGNTSAAASLGPVTVGIVSDDDVVSAQVNIQPTVTEDVPLGSDTYLAVVNLAGLDLQLFADAIEFDVDPGHALDLTFDFSAILGTELLGDYNLVLQKWDEETQQWTSVDGEGASTILSLSLFGGTSGTVEGLESGQYRAFMGYDGLLSAGLGGTLTLSGDDYDFTQISGYEAVPVSGNVMVNDPDVTADTVVQSVDGQAVTAAATEIAGQYGTLSIDPDGAFTYTPSATNGDGIGQVDTFDYTLVDPVTGATTTSTLYVQIGSDGVAMIWDPADPGLPATAAFSASDDTAIADVVWANVTDDNYFTQSEGSLTGLGSQTFTSETFTITDNMDVSGTVTVSSLVAALSSGTLFLERETSPGVWTTVASDDYSIAVGGLGVIANLDLSTIDFVEGTYRVRVTKSGLASVTFNVSTDVDVTYVDQFEIDSISGNTGNLLANDDPGSEFTTLQIFDGTSYVDVTSAGPATVTGAFGSLTVDADGNYTYAPNHTASTETDTFSYQLVHPTGDVEQGSLTITVEPSGAGVVAPLMASEFSMLLEDPGSTIDLGDEPSTTEETEEASASTVEEPVIAQEFAEADPFQVDPLFGTDGLGRLEEQPI